MRPFGLGFEEPRFVVEANIAKVQFYRDKQTSVEKHTAVTLEHPRKNQTKLMFFNAVHKELQGVKRAKFIVTAHKNHFRQVTSLNFFGKDYSLG